MKIIKRLWACIAAWWDRQCRRGDDGPDEPRVPRADDQW